MIPKGRQSNIKRAYEQGKKDMLEEVNEKINEWWEDTMEISTTSVRLEELKKSLGEIK